MRVWLVKLGEPLPVDGPVRLHRNGILANMLVERGHSVTYWTSTFDHARKRQRYPADQTVRLSEGFTIRFLFAEIYKRNVSLARWRHHRQAGKAFQSAARGEPTPDVILASFPAAELVIAAQRYASQGRIPLVVDVRDQYPDVFLTLLPAWLRGAARIALQPQFRTNRRLFEAAPFLTAVSQSMLSWALRNAGRKQRPTDRVFVLGYPESSVDCKEAQAAQAKWDRLGVTGDTVNVCYLGVIGRKVNLDTVVRAARALELEGEKTIKFVIAGTGDHFERYREMAVGLGNIVFSDWIDLPEIAALMERSSVGLAPYCDQQNMDLPNKPFEYFYYGLPVLSSLQGELRQILAENGCGLTYESDSVADLLHNVRWLARHKDEREAMAWNAKRLYATKYSAQVVYTEMIDYLEEVAASHRQNRSDNGH